MAKITVGNMTFETCRAYPYRTKEGKEYLRELIPEKVYTNKQSENIIILTETKDGRAITYILPANKIVPAFKITGVGKNGEFTRIVEDPGGNESLELRMLRASYTR